MINLPKNSQSKIIMADIIIIIILNIIMFFIFSNIDALEMLYDFSKKHENYELDEFIVVFISLSFSLAIFALRRLNESKLLLAELTEMAIKDPLTFLYNRRYFNEELELEIKKARRSNNSFSLIMFDLDFFKNINDNFGHNVGDRVLVQVSNIFMENCRETDIVARWGGEEFIILCNDTQIDGAIELGDKILKTIRNFNFDVVEHITVSVGVTEFTLNDSAETVIKRADKCLYDAKGKGRDLLVHTCIDNEEERDIALKKAIL